MILDQSNTVYEGLTINVGRGESAAVFAPGTKNITLRNCKIVNSRGIRVHGEGHTIESCQIDAFGCGIFAEPDCAGLTIRSNDIKAGICGIYLEYDSHHSHIHSNVIHDCGYWYDDAKLPFRFPRMGVDKREAIAIDASTDNIIQHNVLTNNAFVAGITLYKNCGEFGEPPRKQGANRNTIRYNKIDNEIKVWEAARANRDLAGWGCSCDGRWEWAWKVDFPYQQIFRPMYLVHGMFPIRPKVYLVPDEAVDNVIEGNF